MIHFNGKGKIHMTVQLDFSSVFLVSTLVSCTAKGWVMGTLVGGTTVLGGLLIVIVGSCCL